MLHGTPKGLSGSVTQQLRFQFTFVTLSEGGTISPSTERGIPFSRSPQMASAISSSVHDGGFLGRTITFLDTAEVEIGGSRHVWQDLLF